MDKKYAIGVILLLLFTFSCKKSAQPDSSLVEEEPIDTVSHIYKYGICIDSLDTTDELIRQGDHLAAIYGRLGFSPAESDRICRVSAELLPPTKLRAGMHYTLFTTQDTLQEVRYVAFARSLTDYVIIDFTGDTVLAYSFYKPIALQRKYVEGTITSSLWNVVQQKGVSPLLALDLSDVFAWQIDFFDLKEGDSFQVVYQEAFIDDTTSLNIASIEGAVFVHQGKEFTAIPFTQDSLPEFFDAEGNSLRKEFLKAPLKFSRISSQFSNSRFHPVLKRYRAHHGVDYAAPAGTEVRSIGDGVVTARAFQAGGGGNYVKIKHNSVYTTTYMHLRGFAKGLAVGKRVKQGEVIGYVGSTGLSTGPHLDFRVHKNGQPVNPLTIESPPSHPVKPELMDSFLVVKTQTMAEIDSFRIAQTDTIQLQ
ncbi:peptidoglycan DD-metalloendopeptidase family protein [Parabacteroides sp. OttesenSCG-928-G06]|nr:peptidoglycan DD-metalloendopeptidase family protein [Parabacteroides sp. OttesenSCG-928-K15]MDL2282237.1 peptidoglycan DD-metalloendopeptidase family protein [Parabacteroides sp. OttesenSCG-928-G06]